MTSRTQSLLNGVSRSALLLSFAFIPTLTIAESGISISIRSSRSPYNSDTPVRQSQPVPYLRLVGPPPMRFQEPPAPPAFELEPVATGPAFIESDRPSMAPAQAKEKPETPVHSVPAGKTGAAPTLEKKPEEHEAIPILPDDTRRDVRPEELLPFFQFPRNGGTTMGVRVPVPPQPTAPAMPPSSATYRQQ